MKPNVGGFDRIIRMLIGAFLILAWLAGWMTGVWAIVFGLVGIVLALTSLMGTCFIYRLFGFSTKSSTA